MAGGHYGLGLTALADGFRRRRQNQADQIGQLFAGAAGGLGGAYMAAQQAKAAGAANTSDERRAELKANADVEAARIRAESDREQAAMRAGYVPQEQKEDKAAIAERIRKGRALKQWVDTYLVGEGGKWSDRSTWKEKDHRAADQLSEEEWKLAHFAKQAELYSQGKGDLAGLGQSTPSEAIIELERRFGMLTPRTTGTTYVPGPGAKGMEAAETPPAFSSLDKQGEALQQYLNSAQSFNKTSMTSNEELGAFAQHGLDAEALRGKRLSELDDAQARALDDAARAIMADPRVSPDNAVKWYLTVGGKNEAVLAQMQKRVQEEMARRGAGAAPARPSTPPDPNEAFAPALEAAAYAGLIPMPFAGDRPAPPPATSSSVTMSTPSTGAPGTVEDYGDAGARGANIGRPSAPGVINAAGMDEQTMLRVADLLTRAKAAGLPLALGNGRTGFRTAEDQADLFAQGRTRPGKVVTYADGTPGKESRHQSGEARDFLWQGQQGPTPDEIEMFRGLAAQVGLETLGDWDPFHVQAPRNGFAPPPGPLAASTERNQLLPASIEGMAGQSARLPYDQTSELNPQIPRPPRPSGFGMPGFGVDAPAAPNRLTPEQIASLPRPEPSQPQQAPLPRFEATSISAGPKGYWGRTGDFLSDLITNYAEAQHDDAKATAAAGSSLVPNVTGLTSDQPHERQQSLMSILPFLLGGMGGLGRLGARAPMTPSMGAPRAVRSPVPEITRTMVDEATVVEPRTMVTPQPTRTFAEPKTTISQVPREVTGVTKPLEQTVFGAKPTPSEVSMARPGPVTMPGVAGSEGTFIPKLRAPLTPDGTPIVGPPPALEASGFTRNIRPGGGPPPAGNIGQSMLSRSAGKLVRAPDFRLSFRPQSGAPSADALFQRQNELMALGMSERDALMQAITEIAEAAR